MPRGDYRHLVTFEAPGARVPDGEGGYTEAWAPLDPPTWYIAIRPATARDLEDVTAGTTTASATHVVTGDYRADVTTKARLVHEGRQFEITGIANLDERDETMILLCEELLA